jgi:hypothetical protein
MMQRQHSPRHICALPDRCKRAAEDRQRRVDLLVRHDQRRNPVYHLPIRTLARLTVQPGYVVAKSV